MSTARTGVWSLDSSEGISSIDSICGMVRYMEQREVARGVVPRCPEAGRSEHLLLVMLRERALLASMRPCCMFVRVNGGESDDFEGQLALNCV